MNGQKTRRNEIKDDQTQGRNRTTTKMKTWLQGGETIDSNENLTEGIEETQENNQVNANIHSHFYSIIFPLFILLNIMNLFLIEDTIYRQ